MQRIYIFGSGHRAQCVLTWLSRDVNISRDEISAIIDYPESLNSTETELFGVPVIAYKDIKHQLSEKDIIIVASKLLNEAVGELFKNNIYNLFDGDVIIRRESAAQRFLSVASDLYIGPSTPANCEPDCNNYIRYSAEPLKANKVPPHKLFIVNSMPKSGTFWMIAMLEGVLGVKAKQQVTLSHIRDIETDWTKQNNHGAVALVRDMRDVVVSWFHHLNRADLQSGFSSPRYPNIEEFYFDHFIGQIFGNDRYYFGEFEKWLDFVGANSFPVIKYEDLVVDTQSSLRKVMNFWKVSVSDQSLEEVARNYSFSNIQDTLSGRSGFVSDVLKAGHMRHGRVGSWEKELPAKVAKDINQRFLEYQRRLKYI